MMLATVILWSLGTLICKNSYGDGPESFDVNFFNGVRYLIATSLMFLILLIRGINVRINKEHVTGMASVSFFGMFLFILLFNVGLSKTTAANTGIIMSVIPIVILAVAVLCSVERPNLAVTGGIILSALGVAVMYYKDGVLKVGAGDLFVLASCGFWGIYAVFGEKYMSYYRPMVATAWILFFTSVYYLPFVIMEFPHQVWSEISGWNWFNLVFGAIGPLLIANTLYYMAIHRIGPSRSGIYINLEPVIVVILAFFMRGETVNTMQLIGFAVVLLGVAATKIK